MKTEYGDIPDEICHNYHQVKTVRELSTLLDQLPKDLPIGYFQIFQVSVFNAPSAPVLEIEVEEPREVEDGF
jgi:hypothetical protein